MTERKTEIRRTFWKEHDFPFNDIIDQPLSECEYVDGVMHGRCRRWHENGQLAFDAYYKNGIPDGVGVSWDENGHEICRYEIVNGTGIERVIVRARSTSIVEDPWVNGVRHGIGRHLTPEGKIKAEFMWLHGKNVDFEEYQRACEQDPSLPRHETNESKWAVKAVAAATGDHDAYGREILKEEGVYEVRAWLSAPSGRKAPPPFAGRCYAPQTETGELARTLGEDTDGRESLAIAESFYKAGAKTVWVYEVDEETQNSGCLLIELPSAKKSRIGVLKVCNKWIVKQGLDPDEDEGQQYVAVHLD